MICAGHGFEHFNVFTTKKGSRRACFLGLWQGFSSPFCADWRKSGARQQKDAGLPSAAEPAHSGDTLMDPDGTCKSSVSVEDKAFRFRATQMTIAAGVPLSSMRVMRPALEDMCQKPLSSPNMLAADCIEQMLSQEADSQLEEVKGKQMSVCFDATPRMGDALALIVRCVQTTDEEGA
jgi:hypothetical protein